MNKEIRPSYLRYCDKYFSMNLRMKLWSHLQIREFEHHYREIEKLKKNIGIENDFESSSKN